MSQRTYSEYDDARSRTATTADPDEATVVIPEGKASGTHDTSSGPAETTGGTGLPPNTGVTQRSQSSTKLSRASTIQALRSEEAARASSFGLVMAIICCAAVASLPILGGTLGLSIAMAVSLSAFGAFGAWVWRVASEPGRYKVWMFRVFGVLAVVASLVMTYFFGVFSPAPLAVTLGIAFFGLGDDREYAIRLCLSAIAGYFALSGLVVFNVIPDLGLFTYEGSSVVAKGFMVLMVPTVYLFTLWQARKSRQATVDAMLQLGAALEQARHREEQLNEAQQDLERALKAGAGVAGRHTGERFGEYILGDIIGRGAMGEVYAAETADGMGAAVKILGERIADDDASVRRFVREGKVTAEIKTPNVVRVYSVGVVKQVPYIAMERLIGEDLAAVLRSRERLPLMEATDMVLQVCDGLTAAHAAGVVHRDIKPQNLFASQVGDDLTWKILDFGIAKSRGSSGTLTQRALIGTPGYMSPEQARSLPTDERSDLFSLGAVLYRTLTGRRPFAGDDTPQILFDIVYRMPVRPKAIVKELPSDLESVLAVAMAKEKKDRFRSAEDLARAWKQAVRRQLHPEVRKKALHVLKNTPWGDGGA